MNVKINIPAIVREANKNKRKKVLRARRGIKSSKMIEIDYYSHLSFMVNAITERFENIVLKGIDTAKVKTAIHDESWNAKVNRLINLFKVAIREQFHTDRINNTASIYINKTDRYQKRKFKTMVEYGFGIDISSIPEFRAYKPFINNAVKRNVELITSLRADTVSKLEKMLRVAIEQGTSIKQISVEINKIDDVSKRKASLIARNEIKNVTSMLTKKRLQSVGFDKVEWQSSGDQRVRKDHARFDGKVYTIGVGLKNSEGKYEEAGDAIGCRCLAIPYMEL